MTDSTSVPPATEWRERVAADYAKNRYTAGTSVSLAESLAIAACVADNRLERTLEIGFAHAGSAAAIIAAKRSNAIFNRHIVLDPYQISHSGSRGLEVIEELGYSDDLDFNEVPSEEYLPRCAGTFDFILIDGGHGLGQAMVDAFYCDRLLKIGGYMAVDDIFMPSTAHSLRFLIDECGYKVIPSGPSRPLRQLKYSFKLGVSYASKLGRSTEGLAILKKTRDYRGGY
ncbi:MAG: class I SAM-dependent methyltransferase [Pseudomonadota bacterium]